MKRTILFVCTGNTCRSPMAEALCRRRAEERALQVEAASAGLYPGDRLSENARLALEELGLSIEHTPRPVTAGLLASADLIVAMSERHAHALWSVDPTLPVVVPGYGIPDPFGGSLDDYRHCRDALAGVMDLILDEAFARPPHVRIRPMAEGDLPAIAALERASFSDPWSEQSLGEELANPLAVFLVADRGGEAVGYAGMHLIAGEGFVCNVAVAPEARGRGIGQLLMESLIAHGREDGMRTLSLDVRPSNHAAIALYTRLGFLPAGTRPHFYRQPEEDGLIMNLTLDPPSGEGEASV